MSTHQVEVIRIKEVLPCPNADALEIIPVWGYQAIVRKGQFKPGDLAYYIEPDYVVPERPEYAFLWGDHEPTLARRRVTVRRFRGNWSHGLLMPAEPWMREGRDVIDKLGIFRYEPPAPNTSTTATRGTLPCKQPFPVPVYDVEALRRHPDILVHGEPVRITEKIHGCNARYVFHKGRMFCGSRTTWKRCPWKDDRWAWLSNLWRRIRGKRPLARSCLHDAWWEALRQNPPIEQWCRARPGIVLIGEVFGPVQDLKYGKAPGQYGFAAFDTYSSESRAWSWPKDFQQTVPVLFEGAWDKGLMELADGPSRVAGSTNIREGMVVRPINERWDARLGRVQLKLVSDVYLGRSSGTVPSKPDRNVPETA